MSGILFFSFASCHPLSVSHPSFCMSVVYGFHWTSKTEKMIIQDKFIQIGFESEYYPACLFEHPYTDYLYSSYLAKLAVHKNLADLPCYHRCTREIPEPVAFLFVHGVQIGGIWVFPTIKITVIRQVRMYCGLSVEINMREMPHGVRRLGMHFVCVCFRVCGWQKPEYPQFEPHG